MTRPFLYQANLATKVISGNLRSGKSWGDLSLYKKAWKILQIATLFTLVVPLVTGIIALLGLLLRACASLARPEISVLQNSAHPFKIHKSGETIELTTYNVALMPKFICNLNNMRSPNKRAHEIGVTFEELNHQKKAPDILALQECFDKKATSILCNHLKNIYPQIIYCVSPNEFGLNSGILLASKFKIEAAGFSKFTATCGEDALAHKGFLGVCLDLETGKTLRVFNTHLQAQSGEINDKVRALQVAQLKEQIKEDQNVLAFILGDFNMSLVDEMGNKSSCSLSDTYFHDLYPSKPTTLDIPNGTWYKQTSSSWGTKLWNREVVEGCFFDHILSYPFPPTDFSLTVFRPNLFENKLSEQSDHLPLTLKTKT